MTPAMHVHIENPLCMITKVTGIHVQECCSSGGWPVFTEGVPEAAVDSRRRVLCLLPGTVGNIKNQSQEIWRVGRSVAVILNLLFFCCGLILMFPFHSCDGSFRGHWKGICTGGEESTLLQLCFMYYLIPFTSWRDRD